MAKKSFTTVLVLAMLGLAAPSAAEETQAPAPAAATAVAAPPADPVICHMEPPPLGTRIGHRAICRTKKEWDDLELQTRARFRDIQMHNNQSGPAQAVTSGGG